MIQNVFFDCDSTLVQLEGINELARLKGKFEEVSRLTNQAMSGEIALNQVFAKRLDIIQPSKQDLQTVGQMYIQNLTPGAKEVVESLQSSGRKVFIISAGYQISLEILAQHLQIPLDRVFGIKLDFDEDANYVGYNENQLLTKNTGKKELISQMDLDLAKTAAIGDGANDLATGEIVKIFIGFRGPEQNDFMRQKAKIFVDENNLLPVLTLIENS